MTWYQEWFGDEYLELYAHRDEDEARQQAVFLQSQVGGIEGPVLDLACGTGRHMQEMRALGYHVVGCDLSFTLLITGIREYGLTLFSRADMRMLPFCSGSFAGLVNFFTSFGYFPTHEENLQVVREMSRVLRDDAPFLFDYLNVHRELLNLVRNETRPSPFGETRIERWFDADKTFNKRITIGDKRYLERVRGYDLDEISTMFRDSKLSIDAAFGDFAGNQFNRESPRLILLGRKMQ